MTFRRLSVLAILLLVPAAASSTPFSGELWFAEAPVLAGGVVASLEDGLADLSRASGVDVRFARATGYRETWSGYEVPTGTTVSEQPHREAVAYEAGSISAIRCTGPCVARLVVLGGGRLELGGAVEGTPSIVSQELRRQIEGPFTPLMVRKDARWIAVSAGETEGALAVHEAVASAEGRATLHLWSARATIRTAAGEEPVVTGTSRQPAAPGAPIERWSDVALVLDLEGVELGGAAEGIVLAAGVMPLDLEGTLSSPRADGWISIHGVRREVHGEDVMVEGASQVRLDAGALGGPAASPSDAAAERLHAPLSGQASHVVVGGATHLRAAPPVATAAVATGALAVVLVAAVALKMGAWTALYSRITRSRVLANPRRLAVYEHLRANAGSHVSQIARELGVNRVVLQHHLRMLELHQLVAPRPSGRVVLYFAADQVPDAARLAAVVALKGETRRAVLGAVASSASPLAQKDVVDRTGLSQRLVSYHLRELERSGLVVGEGARPRRFRASIHAEPMAQASSA